MILRRDLEPFRFKQFQVKHSNATLAVGTDAILLASWVNLEATNDVLDVGTGCGLIALSVAQRLIESFKITAIDIDELSVEEARRNFESSEWSSSLESQFVGFEELDINGLDLIISNPPFFRQSLKNEKEHKVKARHQESFSMESFAKFCYNSLDKNGKVALIYPSSDLEYLTQVFKEGQLYLNRICFVKPKESKPINRVMVEFSEENNVLTKESLVIRKEDNSYTQPYIDLTKDYYLNF